MCLKCHWKFEQANLPPWEFQKVGKYAKRLAVLECKEILSIQWSKPHLSGPYLTLSTLSNFNRLFHSLFWNELKRSVGLKGLTGLFTFQTVLFGKSICFSQYNSPIFTWNTCTLMYQNCLTLFKIAKLCVKIYLSFYISYSGGPILFGCQMSC